MRLDEFLYKAGYFDSRNKAKYAVTHGEVFSDGKKLVKPSLFIDENTGANIEIRAEEFFVSVGGYKLSKALKDFGVSVNDKIVADIGSSTGGFTDCLLKNGAKKVYAVDINCEQLHDSLKENPKVVPIEKNVKSLVSTDFGEEIDMIVADLSFISVTSVISVIDNILSAEKEAIILIKPQFEVGYKKRFKNGIIRESEIRRKACFSVYEAVITTAFRPIAATVAPVSEDKNTEYLLLLKKTGGEIIPFDAVFNEKLF